MFVMLWMCRVVMQHAFTAVWLKSGSYEPTGRKLGIAIHHCGPCAAKARAIHLGAALQGALRKGVVQGTVRILLRGVPPIKGFYGSKLVLGRRRELKKIDSQAQG